MTFGVTPHARRQTFSSTLAWAGLVLFAVWSITWEREFLGRQAAIWRAGQELMARGVPPEAIDGGFEWNGWYRGQAVIAAAVQRARTQRTGRWIQGDIYEGLHMKQAPWALAFSPPQNDPKAEVVIRVPYGPGQEVLGLRRTV